MSTAVNFPPRMLSQPKPLSFSARLPTPGQSGRIPNFQISASIGNVTTHRLERQPSMQKPPTLQRQPTQNLGRTGSGIIAGIERKLSIGGYSLERKASIGLNRLERLGSSVGNGGLFDHLASVPEQPWGGSSNSQPASWHAVPAPHSHAEHQKKMGVVASAAAVGGAVHAGRAAVQRRSTLSHRQMSGSWGPSSLPSHPEMEDGETGVYFEDTPRLAHAGSMSAALEFDPLDLGSSHLMSQLEIQNTRSGVAEKIQSAYQGLLKQDWPVFIASLFAAPAALSAVFGVLYMLDPAGLALDDSVVQSAASFGCPASTVGSPGLFTYLNAVMMSMSMSTGVDPVMHAVSPFTMLVSQLNGLASQCMFVLLSGAVFARLSQPSQPVVCAEKALLCNGAADARVLATRYVTRHEMVDVRVSATVTRTIRTSNGSWTRTEQPLRLAQSEAAYQSEGMVIQHVVDRSSPLYGCSEQDLKEQDVVLRCSIVGLDRATMGSVFHVEEYKAKDGKLALAR